MMAGEGRRGFRLRSAALYIATGTVLAATLAACGSAAGTTTATVAAAQTETINETGSSLLAPLMGDWVKGYEAQTPGVTVNPVSSSSGTGIKNATSGSADIGTSDAYLSSGDLVKKPSLVNIPLAVSAQTVIYNLPGVSGNLKLNGTILAEIYQGKITTWDDPLITSLTRTRTSVLNVISRSGNASFSDDFSATHKNVDTWLSEAASVQDTGQGSNGASLVAAAQRDTTAWYAATEKVYTLGVHGNYAGERDLVVGSVPGNTVTGYNALEGDLSAALKADQDVFSSAVASGADALDPLTGGIAAASLLMVLGCGWAVTRRLAEYR